MEIYINRKKAISQIKYLLLWGGSDVQYDLTNNLAKMFCENGFHSLALGYWKAEGLPKNIGKFPLNT